MYNVRVAHQRALLFQVTFCSERYLGMGFCVIQFEVWIDIEPYVIVFTKVK